MRCPYCRVSFSEQHLAKLPNSFHASSSIWSVKYYTCAECNNPIVVLDEYDTETDVDYLNNIVYPKNFDSEIKKAPLEVDGNFNETSAILRLSPKASAALSRRCLQNILREKAGVKKGDLAKEIQEVIDSGKLPSYIAEGIDAIRNIGNYAAHPAESQSTGEIVIWSLTGPSA